MLQVQQMGQFPKTVKHRWWKTLPQGNLTQVKGGDIVCGDALKVLSCLKPNSAEIVFLDPPFNLGKKYGSNSNQDDRKSEILYVSFMTDVINMSVDVLKDGGALYLYHIPKWAVKFSRLLESRLEFRHWIAISMKNGFVRGKSLYPAHYSLLYYTKGRPVVFNRPKIPVPTCRHCHEYLKDYGGYKQYVENGLNLSDVWDDISPVRHNKYKNRTANELPMEIPRRVVQISGRKNGLLVDPFAGTGSSLVAARERGMRFVACDKEPDSQRIMMKRLSASK